MPKIAKLNSRKTRNTQVTSGSHGMMSRLDRKNNIELMEYARRFDEKRFLSHNQYSKDEIDAAVNEFLNKSK